MRLPVLSQRLAWAVGAAALLLAITSRGEVIVLGALLLLLELRPTAAAAIGGALLASSWRWGTTSLEALAGAQAVLGPAGGVGPTTAAAASWLAAIAVVLALARQVDPLQAAVAGAVAAALVAGPAPGGELLVRAFAALGAAVAAYGLAQVRWDRPRLDLALALLAAAAGAGAVAAASREAPGWPPSTEGRLVVEGVALAAAAGAAVLVGAAAQKGARWRQWGARPRVDRPWAPLRAARRQR